MSALDLRSCLWTCQLLYVNNNHSCGRLYLQELWHFIIKNNKVLQLLEMNSLIENLKIHRNENSTKLFSYAGNGKYFEQLFTLVLNGIAINGWCVSSALSDWLWRMQRNKTIINEETRKQWRIFPKWNINITVQWQVLSVHARVNKLIIYITMHKQKASINMLSRSKEPKTQ